MKNFAGPSDLTGGKLGAADAAMPGESVNSFGQLYLRMTPKSSLLPLENVSMADRVEGKLREYFEEMAFKPGDSLPNELEISQKLSVSRPIVREALSRLRMLGMIETKPRRGMVMSKPDLLGGLERVLNPLILSKENLDDIFELRLILEMGIAEFLFARRSEEKLRELEEIVVRQERLPMLGKEDEVEFHGKLYEMTENQTFKRFQSLLMPVFDHVFREYHEHGRRTNVTSTVTHRDLLNVLRTGTPAVFREAMLNHLAPYFSSIANRSSLVAEST